MNHQRHQPLPDRRSFLGSIGSGFGSVAFAALAAEFGAAPATLAIAWCLRNRQVCSVILGASRVEQLLENLQAIEWTERLAPEAWERVEGVLAR